MSIWLRREDKEGRVHYVSIGVDPVVIFATFGFLVALLLPLIHACIHSTRQEAEIEVSTPADTGGTIDWEQKETKVTKNGRG